MGSEKQDQNPSHSLEEFFEITCGMMRPGETKNNHNNPYSQISQSLMSRCIKNDSVGWASLSSQSRLLSQSTTTWLSCSWTWDTKGLIKQPLTWDNWESQRALPAGAAGIGIARVGDGEGTDQEKWAAGNEQGFKESTV